MSEFTILPALALFVVLIVGAVIFVIVRSSNATHRQEDIGWLGSRVVRLEREMNRLSAELAQLRAVLPAPPPAETPSPTPEEVPEVVLVDSPEGPAPHSFAPAAARPQQPELDTAALESWIGRRGLGWAAVVVLLFATAFFLKYAFDNEWIGELGRVSIGLLAGTGLCLAGLRYHGRGWRVFSQMLTAAGILLLYLANYSAFGYYHLVPRGPAAVFLIVTGAGPP
jgi:uncharacterized membrane protein